MTHLNQWISDQQQQYAALSALPFHTVKMLVIESFAVSGRYWLDDYFSDDEGQFDDAIYAASSVAEAEVDGFSFLGHPRNSDLIWSTWREVLDELVPCGIATLQDQAVSATTARLWKALCDSRRAEQSKQSSDSASTEG